MMRHSNIRNFLIAFTLVSLSSVCCKKFVQVSPPTTRLSTPLVFSSDATATSAVVGIYSKMISSSGFASGDIGSVGFLAGLSADELTDYSNTYDQTSFYINSISPINGVVSSLWGEPYQYIYDANAVLEGIAVSTAISSPLRSQLEGEAKFIRAFCHFYLANLFGDVPLILSTGYQANATAAKAPRISVYRQIIADLKDAQRLLQADYSASGNERTRPNKWAATGLLARAYLYVGAYDSAEAQASTIISNTALYSLCTDLNAVFLKNSTEAIWQLQPVKAQFNTDEGALFILTDIPYEAALSPSLLASFEHGDLRLTNWVDSFSNGAQAYYYPFKYKVQQSSTVTEYSMVLRLAEQYLIRAEARAMQNEISGAQSDLDSVRLRAGLPATLASTTADLLAALVHERQVELFTEWGHRWLDLKRLNFATAVLSSLKPNWKGTDTLYPIPKSEIETDPNLSQNPGY